MSKSVVTWENNMSFDVLQDGHHITLDAGKPMGEDKGVRPKGLLLSALGGCAGMDIVSILKKMKVTDFKFRMEIEGEQTEEHPKVYHTINFNFLFEGENLPFEKIKRAVTLSDERYCGVSAMLKQVVKINKSIKVNGELI